MKTMIKRTHIIINLLIETIIFLMIMKNEPNTLMNLN